MSNLVRCPAGLHQYDADRYSVCPYCGSVSSNDGDTRPVGSPVDEDMTRPIGSPGSSATVPGVDDEATRVLRTGGKQAIRPVTGWLVVVEGPGTGASLPVYHGVNIIARNDNAQISLSFGGHGDAKISRTEQARLTYDPKGNAFYLQHGDASNLTYLNDEPVLELKTLEAWDRITMGDTSLLFVPFCGERFQWPE